MESQIGFHVIKTLRSSSTVSTKDSEGLFDCDTSLFNVPNDFALAVNNNSNIGNIRYKKTRKHGRIIFVRSPSLSWSSHSSTNDSTTPISSSDISQSDVEKLLTTSWMSPKNEEVSTNWTCIIC
ncbi:unnamed protein product [Didymodactylos carnosus]|uniref:Uncharacterized protein n=1 Tax=Didymodactylos carnosus TaxID=1234261 RepID=A0A8S2EAH3_9BILA|nr:unnamed protein product [Didymodactylos carnosus]CAF3871887.1 unnamed protein product [Didymodactylos carnosus]